MKSRLVLIGNGMAGMRVVETLCQLAPERYQITVLGKEAHGNYNRIQLSPLLAGEKSLGDILIHDAAWYDDNGVTFYPSTEVTSIDRANKAVQCADGRLFEYDQLLLGTGSNPFILPIPGNDLTGVISFRDIQDVDAMLAASEKGGHAVVIGGGLLGLEAAYGLHKQGMQVTVVHIMADLMERQLDTEAAAMLKESLEGKGLRFEMQAKTVALHGDEQVQSQVQSVEFADGRTIPADLVVMAAGIRPNIGLAQDAGLDCERGVLVNDAMQTSDAHIFAVGECVQHRGQVYGLVAPLYEQAKVLAAQLNGDASAQYQGSQVATRLKVTGLDVFSAGDYLPQAEDRVLRLRAKSQGIYKKLVLRGSKLVGAVLIGDVQDSAWYQRLIFEGTDIQEIREGLMFGEAFCQTQEAA